MELQKYQGQITQARRLNESPAEDFQTFLSREIHRLFALQRNKPEDAEIILLAEELYLYLLETWPGVKNSNIQQAFKNGRFGKYGKYDFIKFSTLVNWIEEYNRLDWDGGRPALNKRTVTSGPMSKQFGDIVEGIRKHRPGLNGLIDSIGHE